MFTSNLSLIDWLIFHDRISSYLHDMVHRSWSDDYHIQSTMLMLIMIVVLYNNFDRLDPIYLQIHLDQLIHNILTLISKRFNDFFKIFYKQKITSFCIKFLLWILISFQPWSTRLEIWMFATFAEMNVPISIDMINTVKNMHLFLFDGKNDFYWENFYNKK